MLQAGERIADGQLPYRDFYANYGPGQYFLVGGARRAVRPLAADAGGSCAWRSTPAWPCSPTRSPAATPPSRWRSAPGSPSPRRWRSRASRTPTRPRWRSASARCCSPQRRPVLAGGARRAWRSCSGSTWAWRRWPEWRSGGRREAGRARRAARRAVARRAAGARSCWPRPGDFWDQTIGFALDEQGLQRLPLPGAWDGGFEPNKILAALLPVRAAGRRAPSGWSWPSRSPAAGAPVGALLRWRRPACVYLLARADVFHLVPLAAVLPVLLATAAARERRAGRTVSTVALVVVLGLIACTGSTASASSCSTRRRWRRSTSTWPTGSKAPPAEARALSELSRYVRARVPPGRAGVRRQPALRPRHGSATRSSTCSSGAPTRPATT